MSQRAALYRLEVHAHGRPRPLGDLDGAGTGLAAVLAAALPALEVVSPDGTTVVRTHSVRGDGEDLLAVLRHGRRGLAAEIVAADGAVRLRQEPADLQLMRSGCLFRLPVEATSGVCAMQVQDGRGAKELLADGLRALVAVRVPGARLVLAPFPDPDGLAQAVADDRVVAVELTSAVPSPVAPPETAAWLGAQEHGTVELRIAARPGGRLRTDLIARWLAGDGEALREILRFGGLVFERATIVTVTPGGGRRRLGLTPHEPAGSTGGGPLTRLLGAVRLDADGEPDEESLLEALRAVVDAAPTGSG